MLQNYQALEEESERVVACYNIQKFWEQQLQANNSFL